MIKKNGFRRISNSSSLSLKSNIMISKHDLFRRPNSDSHLGCFWMRCLKTKLMELLSTIFQRKFMRTPTNRPNVNERLCGKRFSLLFENCFLISTLCICLRFDENINGTSKPAKLFPSLLSHLSTVLAVWSPNVSWMMIAYCVWCFWIFADIALEKLDKFAIFV